MAEPTQFIEPARLNQNTTRRALVCVIMLHEPVLKPFRRKQYAQRSPLFIPPLLPTLADEPPQGDEWEQEIKYDGYRTLLVVREGEGRAFTRNGHDWTATYQPVVRAAVRLQANSATIDGEMIVQDAQGRSDFAALRSAIEREPHRLVFMAFDLLEVDGQDMRDRPLEARREHLRDLVGKI
jgi:ATP-dependent DNA ligase